MNHVRRPVFRAEVAQAVFLHIWTNNFDISLLEPPSLSRLIRSIEWIPRSIRLSTDRQTYMLLLVRKTYCRKIGSIAIRHRCECPGPLTAEAKTTLYSYESISSRHHAKNMSGSREGCFIFRGGFLLPWPATKAVMILFDSQPCNLFSHISHFHVILLCHCNSHVPLI